MPPRIMKLKERNNNFEAGGRNMKKLFITVIVLVVTVIASILYGAHTLISQDEQMLLIEQAYMAQYPVQIPQLVMD